MIDKSLIKNILDSYSIKRYNANLISENNKQKALENEEYQKLDTQKRALILKKGKFEFEKKDIKEIDKELKDIEEKQSKALSTLSISLSDLYPKFECQKCNDTGFVNGNYCSCLKQAYNNLLMQKANVNLENIPLLKDYDFSIYDKQEQQEMKLAVRKFEDFVKDFDNIKIKNIMLLGGTGVGKTYLAQSITKEILTSGRTALFTSAFNLNNFFLKMHTSQSVDKIVDLNGYIDAEFLVIDDLGTEPILKNVSKEYLLLLLNERYMQNKSTLITSNMFPNNILDKYGERIFSRMFNKASSITVNITGKDLRIKKA